MKKAKDDTDTLKKNPQNIKEKKREGRGKSRGEQGKLFSRIPESRVTARISQEETKGNFYQLCYCARST